MIVRYIKTIDYKGRSHGLCSLQEIICAPGNGLLVRYERNLGNEKKIIKKIQEYTGTVIDIKKGLYNKILKLIALTKKERIKEKFGKSIESVFNLVDQEERNNILFEV